MNVILKIGGDGPLRKKLEKLADTLGIGGQVFFLGYLNREAVLTEMQKCDVFVLSSLSETFGVVLIEALCCGKPVISTACGGPEDIVNPGNGVLVKTGDANAFSNAMVNIVGGIEEYDALQIARECVIKYGEDVITSRFMTMYKQILGT